VPNDDDDDDDDDDDEGEVTACDDLVAILVRTQGPSFTSYCISCF
jgi:hypothetical protein